MSSIVERLFWEVVSSNQSEFPDEHCVSIVGPDSNLEDKDAIRGVLQVDAPPLHKKYN